MIKKSKINEILMPLDSSNSKQLTVPPPFSELAMPSAEHYYDLSDPEVLKEKIPECREIFGYYLEKIRVPKKAALIVLRQMELEGDTRVTENGIEDIRKKLTLVAAINSCKAREGSSYLRAVQYL